MGDLIRNRSKHTSYLDLRSDRLTKWQNSTLYQSSDKKWSKTKV